MKGIYLDISLERDKLEFLCGIIFTSPHGIKSKIPTQLVHNQIQLKVLHVHFTCSCGLELEITIQR